MKEEVCVVTPVTCIITGVLSSSFWLFFPDFIQAYIWELNSATGLTEIVKGLNSQTPARSGLSGSAAAATKCYNSSFSIPGGLNGQLVMRNVTANVYFIV